MLTWRGSAEGEKKNFQLPLGGMKCKKMIKNGTFPSRHTRWTKNYLLSAVLRFQLRKQFWLQFIFSTLLDLAWVNDLTSGILEWRAGTIFHGIIVTHFILVFFCKKNLGCDVYANMPGHEHTPVAHASLVLPPVLLSQGVELWTHDLFWSTKLAWWRILIYCYYWSKLWLAFRSASVGEIRKDTLHFVSGTKISFELFHLEARKSHFWSTRSFGNWSEENYLSSCTFIYCCYLWCGLWTTAMVVGLHIPKTL